METRRAVIELKTKQVNVRLPVGLYDKLTDLSHDLGLTISSVIRCLLHESIKGRKP